jgi:hypothetical protein
MRQIGLYALLMISALSALLFGGWLVFLLLILIAHDGNYTLTRTDGWPLLSVNVFPDDDWFRAIMLLFGLPSAFLIISIKLIKVSLRGLTLGKLP